MKKTLLFLFLCSVFSIGAQVTNEGNPASWKLAKKDLVKAITIPSFNIKIVKEEDSIRDKLASRPYRIGILKKINYDLESSGSWVQLPNGDRIWKILFHSKDAIHLSVNFDNFFLPEGAKLYLYNDDRSDVLGAYTETQNNTEHMLSTWFVKGDKLWIEYFEPKEVKGQGKLHLASIIHGYRLGRKYQKGYHDKSILKINNSGDCNYDVDCAVGVDFETNKNLVKKAVAFLRMGDGYICSGALINNTTKNKKPYFLTADHCYERAADETPANAALFSFRFNWISPDPVCAAVTKSTNSSSNFTISGSKLRVRNIASDVMLLEINKQIPDNWDVTFAGWDRTDNNPTYEVGIHHPRGDIMKVCRDDTGAVKANAGGTSLWLIGGLNDSGSDSPGNGWEIGVTEGGSSGSPLFDQNGRIIGQLYAGEANCTGTIDNNHYDIYGRFSVSWDGGTSAATRLMDWLDPQGTNPNTLDALQNRLAVNDEILDKSITVFPNPTSGFLQIKINEWASDLNYEVYNILGQTLLKNKLQNNEIINLDKLPDDIYFLKIIDIDTQKSIVKKIVLKK